MKKFLRCPLIAIMAASLAACSTTSVVADTRSSSAAAAEVSAKRLAPGDNLGLQLTSGEQVLLKLSSIESDALVGTTKDQGASVRVPIDQIEKIKRKELTVFAYAAVGVFALLVAAIPFLIIHVLVAP